MKCVTDTLLWLSTYSSIKSISNGNSLLHFDLTVYQCIIICNIDNIKCHVTVGCGNAMITVRQTLTTKASAV